MHTEPQDLVQDFLTDLCIRLHRNPQIVFDKSKVLKNCAWTLGTVYQKQAKKQLTEELAEHELESGSAREFTQLAYSGAGSELDGLREF